MSGGNGVWLLNGYGVSFGVIRNVLKLDSGDGCTMNIIKISELHAIKCLNAKCCVMWI